MIEELTLEQWEQFIVASGVQTEQAFGSPTRKSCSSVTVFRHPSTIGTTSKVKI